MKTQGGMFQCSNDIFWNQELKTSKKKNTLEKYVYASMEISISI